MLEVLIVIVIVAILLGVSTASFIPMIDRTNSRETTDSLKANVNFARGEAIIRGGWIAMCGSADGQTCQDTYDNGWVVFQDLDRDNTLTAVDTVLSATRQEHEKLTFDVVESGNNGGPLYFNFKGFPDRELLFTTKLGDSEHSFTLMTSGVIESK